ncbi:MAG TPA: FtsX-like permease family protein [Ktedonobacteraceae bacterium]|nr:FtsX-like permease family protein [Ktedonobacteraceae bacterium]
MLLGTATALLLALLGNLVASWLNARSRLVNFAALRALGTTPRQIASTLAWEQVVVYSAAMLLGCLFEHNLNPSTSLKTPMHVKIFAVSSITK